MVVEVLVVVVGEVVQPAHLVDQPATRALLCNIVRDKGRPASLDMTFV